MPGSLKTTSVDFVTSRHPKHLSTLDPLWRQRLNRYRRIFVENLGVRDLRDLASWGAAFFVAYWLWVRPARKEHQQNQVPLLQPCQRSF